MGDENYDSGWGGAHGIHPTKSKSMLQIEKLLLPSCLESKVMSRCKFSLSLGNFFSSNSRLKIPLITVLNYVENNTKFE